MPSLYHGVSVAPHKLLFACLGLGLAVELAVLYF